MGPTLAGFLTFIANVMQIPTSALPSNSQYPSWAYNFALQVVNPQLGLGICPAPGNWSIYALAVYNLAGHTLILYAQDQSGQTYFSKLRGPIADGGYGINAFVAGVVQSAADETTSDSLVVPESLKGLTLMNLQQLKTPWGINYLNLAQDFGQIWGVS